jgi:hypothetical protein
MQVSSMFYFTVEFSSLSVIFGFKKDFFLSLNMFRSLVTSFSRLVEQVKSLLYLRQIFFESGVKGPLKLLLYGFVMVDLKDYRFSLGVFR